MFYLAIIVGLGLMFALLVISERFFTASQKTLNILEALVRTKRDQLDIATLEKLIRTIKEEKTLTETYYKRFSKIMLISSIVLILIEFVICNYLW